MRQEQVVSTDAVYGRNYRLGDTFFVYKDDSIVSYGIAWFSRPKWDQWPPPIIVSHTGIIAGPDNTIEALNAGTVQSDLFKYFADPHAHIFFRHLRNWDADLARAIVHRAGDELGERYGYGTIAADLLSHTLLGRFLNWGFQGRPNIWVQRLLGSPKRPAVCSVMVAIAHKAQLSLDGVGVFRKPAMTVTPQDLFDDQAAYLPLN